MSVEISLKTFKSSLKAPKDRDIKGTYHWFIGILLELHKSYPGDVLHVNISIGAVEVFAPVEIGHKRGRRDAHGIFAVDLVRHDVMCLEQRLERSNP